MNEIDVLERKVELIGDYLDRLVDYVGPTEEGYLADDRSKAASERMVEMIVLCAVDINGIICLLEGAPTPASYRQSFLDLADIRVIPRELAESLARYSSMRNRLAHEYDEIDDGVVFRSIQLSIPHIQQYTALITAYVEKRQTTESGSN